MIYELDLSKIDNKKCLHEKVLNFKYYLKQGEYGMDFDLIECDVPKDIYEEMVSGITEDQKNYPLGFNIDTLPAGSVLTKIDF